MSYQAFAPVLDWGGAVAAAAGLGPHQALLPQLGQAAWHIVLTPLVFREEDAQKETPSGKEENPC